MKTETKYISELGRSFDTPKEAARDDLRLPGIIETYQNDLKNMIETRTFAGNPVTDELIESWIKSIANYEEMRIRAQESFRHYPNL